MKLTIRVYKRHDLDLLYLCKQEADYDFRAELKSALKAYIANKPKVNKIPMGYCKPVSSLPSVVQMHIMLDPKEDKEVVSWIKTITKGRRNNLIKNIFRNTFPPIEIPYRDGSEHHSMN